MRVAALVMALILALAARGAVAADSPALTPVAASDEFSFVVLGDSQFDDPVVFESMIEEVARLRPAFVVQTGDLIDGYTDDDDVLRAQWSRFRAQIAPLGSIPFIAVPGNHDRYGADREPSRAALRAWSRQWPDVPYAFDYRNARFVVLDSDSADAPRALGSRQLEWLDRTLSESDRTHAFVFLHRPPETLADHAELREVIARHPAVRTVFFGHLHHYEQRIVDGTAWVMTNATGASPLSFEASGNFAHFVHVWVRDGETGHAVIRAGSVLPADRVAPSDNADAFALVRELVDVTRIDPATLDRTQAGWPVRVHLSNPTDQVLYAELAWIGTGSRWRIAPESATRVTLPAGARDKAISFELQSVGQDMPPSWPTLVVEVGYRTTRGEWIPIRREIPVASPPASPAADE